MYLKFVDFSNTYRNKQQVFHCETREATENNSKELNEEECVVVVVPNRHRRRHLSPHH